MPYPSRAFPGLTGRALRAAHQRLYRQRHRDHVREVWRAANTRFRARERAAGRCVTCGDPWPGPSERCPACRRYEHQLALARRGLARTGLTYRWPCGTISS